jgi:hypothetical protein
MMKIVKIGIIYAYINRVNGKVYVGQTTREKQRMNEHYNNAFKKHLKNKFYNALRKYGKDNFEYKVLKSLTLSDADNHKSFKELLDKTERQYIHEYNSYLCGYNGTIGGNNDSQSFKSMMSEPEVKKKICSAVKQIDTKTGQIIATFDSITQAGLTFNKSHRLISRACYGDRKTAYGYRWEYILSLT